AGLVDLRGKFIELRKVADALRKSADDALAEAERDKTYKGSFGKAWKELSLLSVRGKRFQDLAESIRLPVRIETSPVDVTVNINGEDVGQSPLTYLQRPGKALRIHVSKVGYVTQEKTVPVTKLGSGTTSVFESACHHRFFLEIIPLTDTFLIRKEKVVSDPVAAGGSLYLATDLGKVIAVKLSGPHLRKEHSFHPSKHGLDQGFKTRLISSKTHVFFPCEDGRVYRVDRAPKGPPTDTLVYYETSVGEVKHNIRERGGAALSQDGKTLVVGTNRGVTAFDVQSRDMMWQFVLEEEDDRIWAIPVCSGDLVLAGTDSGKILAFDLLTGPRDGSPLWSSPSLGSSIRSDLAVHGEVLYVGTDNGNLYYVDLSKTGEAMKAGEGMRQHYIGQEAPITCKPLFSMGAVFVTAGSMVYKLDAKEPGEIWHFDAGGRSGTVSPPALYGDSIFVGNGDGGLFSLDHTGAKAVIRWTKKVQGTVKVRPAVDGDGTVYFLTGDDNAGVRIVPFRE
ncbi:MAG: outer membrane protein assembly factor BamB family protein, partial [Planctomycetota bacterium]